MADPNKRNASAQKSGHYSRPGQNRVYGGNPKKGGSSGRNQQKQKSMLPLILIVVATLAVIALVIGITSCVRKPPTDNSIPAAAQPASPSATPGNTATAIVPESSPEPDAALDAGTPDASTASADTGTTSADPGISSADTASAEKIATRPTAEPGGYLPIFTKANTEEKIIAITVDDCFQTENLNSIIDCTLASGGKLTIFPIGKNLKRPELQEVIRKAYSLDMEIENHSYNHAAFYRMSDENMAREIFEQNRIVSKALGVNYQMHFMRTRGGDNRRDLRTHQYIEKMGYYGMSHWSVGGSKSDIETLKTSIAPGNIYLFHTTDSDLSKLQQFIPYAVAQGYTLVTLNEMFGLPPNKVTEVTTPIDELEFLEPDPYVYDYKTLKKGDHLWDVYLVQQRLTELGWLNSKADGVYGNDVYNAIGYFQLASGIKPTGKASPETQEVLFSDTALKSNDGEKAIGAKGAAIAPTGSAGATDTAAATPDTNAPVPTTAPRVTTPPEDIDMTLFD